MSKWTAGDGVPVLHRDITDCRVGLQPSSQRQNAPKVKGWMQREIRCIHPAVSDKLLKNTYFQMEKM